MRRSQKELLEAARARLATLPHARAAAAFLATPPGGALLSALENLFILGDLAGETVEMTYFNLGAREVVLYLRRLGSLTTERIGTDVPQG